jgi:hypothetical protein
VFFNPRVNFTGSFYRAGIGVISVAESLIEIRSSM